MGAHQPPRWLTREELARAVPVEPAEIDELLEWGLLKPDSTGHFRPSDIQRVRAVMAMRSPGIELGELVEAFNEQLFTLQPMDVLYPTPAVVTDTTPADLATELGIAEADVVRLMITAGLPAPVAGGPMREDDIGLARDMLAAARRLSGDEILSRFARAYGDTARRAAESGVAMFNEYVNSPVINARLSDDERMATNRMAAELMTSSELLLGRLYRRHLEHTLLRMWANAAESFLDQIGVRPARPASDAIAFVDLTGYTALTDRAGDTVAVRLADTLAGLAEEAVARFDGRVVKLLGDGAMLHFGQPAAAARGALTLVERIAATDLPPAHAGVHSGPLIERDGDYFGSTVNLAARIGGEATGGQVFASQAVAQAGAADLDFVSLGERELKGLAAQTLYQVRWHR